ncbi:hypothetical protein [Neomoorella humiferrea]|uniref:hypothetical protein n=1 Tax=Neomoorella humiferrea TaxID=676965 RepID=UPI003D94AE05
MINFDVEFNMRDLYYPYVGWPNHIGRERNRLGCWVDEVSVSPLTWSHAAFVSAVERYINRRQQLQR